MLKANQTEDLLYVRSDTSSSYYLYVWTIPVHFCSLFSYKKMMNVMYTNLKQWSRLPIPYILVLNLPLSTFLLFVYNLIVRLTGFPIYSATRLYFLIVYSINPVIECPLAVQSYDYSIASCVNSIKQVLYNY